MAHTALHLTRNRFRNVPAAPGNIQYGILKCWYYSNNYGTYNQTGPASALNPKQEEYCVDALHHRSKSGGWKCGGDFKIRRVKEWRSYWSGTMRRGTPYVGFWDTYTGLQVPQFRGISGSPSYAPPTDGSGDVSSYGAQAWNMFKPGRPRVQLSVSIAELRDIPRMLKSTLFFFRKEHRNIGNQYLNVNFGWLPFLSDVQNMIQTYHKLDVLLDRIRKNNGKWTLRSGSVVDKESIRASTEWTGTTGFAFSPALTTNLYQVSTARTLTNVIDIKRVWFSGRFRYYIPDKVMQSPTFRRDTIRKIYGLTITPADLWEAMPWSWLIDYFTNAGDILSNLSTGTVDDVVAKYAYVMGETICRHEQHSSVLSADGQLIAGDIYREQAYKSRCAANPFGFDASPDLSDRRLAILAALGISRLR